MPDNSFDIVSKIELPEVSNGVQQALKEIHQRFDLKDSHSSIELNEKDNKILLQSQDEFKLKAVIDILEAKLVKRKVPLKGLSFGVVTPAASSTVRQEITLQQGIAIVLIFIGLKMLLEYFEIEIPVYISLVVIVICILASIMYSITVSNRALENKKPDAGIDREIH